MDAHRAVGATVVSAALFASLLLSSALLLASSRQSASDYSLADGESELTAGSAVLQAVAGVELLSRVQAFLSSASFDCPGAAGEAYSGAGRVSASVEGAGLTVGANTLEGRGAPGPDNITMLGRFDGGVSGGFNIAVLITATGSIPGGRVAFSKAELHTLNLPFDPAKAQSFCLDAVSSLSSDLDPLLEQGCNATVIAASAASDAAALRQSAEAQGLRISVSYLLAPGLPCMLSLAVDVFQPQIAGPDGPFTWHVREVLRLP